MTATFPAPNDPVTVHHEHRTLVAHGVVHEIVGPIDGQTVLAVIDYDPAIEDAVLRTFVVNAYARHAGRWHAFAATPAGVER